MKPSAAFGSLMIGMLIDPFGLACPFCGWPSALVTFVWLGEAAVPATAVGPLVGKALAGISAVLLLSIAPPRVKLPKLTLPLPLLLAASATNPTNLENSLIDSIALSAFW